ncbi:glycosyltransferase family 2 protein [Corynebacterium suicordis]|uniref:Glycosyltransferase family 2 protein n=1 Tax=Corynebacterium suicordis DSM 45110 TaxID=1121369 RepID=A0ABR9ZHV8_9CORY|nr:glycosyltransferase family 2 protein [Corynebacterium suicordis]MBF4553021.1 glycosyltransferase family 2 protein [Corynebacterium suicordis DSM 45110]MDR6278017.1 N-acetylglucosaminyl-diphospho-decaprenol L-rhamnosyltransferase [Corynebacterium suicordis]
MAPIAIITVTFSPGQHLWDFAGSVPAATTAGSHVVMVDNGSKDGSPEAVAEALHPMAVELVHSGGNIGYGAGMNLGVEHVRALRDAGEIDSEFFVIANPDVIFSPGAIEKMVDVARAHPRAGAVGPVIREADGTEYPSAREIPGVFNGVGHALLGEVWPGNPWTVKYQQQGDMKRERTAGWLSGSCLLLRWDAFDSVGGFDERYFMYMEDVDLGDRLAKAGWTNVFTPAAEIAHAQGHSASKHPEITLRAHHESAYRFQADRLRGPVQAPVRWALKAGLAVRCRIAIWSAKRALHA